MSFRLTNLLSRSSDFNTFSRGNVMMLLRLCTWNKQESSKRVQTSHFTTQMVPICSSMSNCTQNNTVRHTYGLSLWNWVSGNEYGRPPKHHDTVVSKWWVIKSKTPDNNFSFCNFRNPIFEFWGSNESPNKLNFKVFYGFPSPTIANHVVISTTWLNSRWIISMCLHCTTVQTDKVH